jgi:NAD(P)-dependent dehydrogenase (short-subunit alcohol dehydrogenase family)
MKENKHQKYNNPVTATLTGIRDLFRRQIPAGELKASDRLDGKTVLVDGASSGLGFAVATHLARRGAKVVMACRSGIPEMGEKVRRKSGNHDIHMLHVDFADTESIRHLVTEIKEKFAPLDVLVCNAGIVPKQSRKTRQGLEEMFMVNYFSKFIFVNLLLENQCFRSAESVALKPESGNRKAEIPRIIFVASESHRNPEKFQWDEFGRYKDYQIGKSIELYGYYKLLLTTFSCELARRLNKNGETSISVFSMCPGPVNSNIAREAPKIFIPLLKVVFGIFFKSPVKAAIPVVYLAASKDLEGKSFDYLFLMSRKEVDEKATDRENGKRLWELSEQLRGRLKTI